MADFVLQVENKHRMVVMVVVVVVGADRKKLETLEYNGYSKHTPKTCNLGQ